MLRKIKRIFFLLLSFRLFLRGFRGEFITSPPLLAFTTKEKEEEGFL